MNNSGPRQDPWAVPYSYIVDVRSHDFIFNCIDLAL